jgi:hypothetical protein
MFNFRQFARLRSNNHINEFIRAEYKNEIRSLTQNGISQNVAITGIRNRLGF